MKVVRSLAPSILFLAIALAVSTLARAQETYIVYKPAVASLSSSEKRAPEFRSLGLQAARAHEIAADAGAKEFSQLSLIGGGTLVLRDDEVGKVGESLQAEGYALEKDSPVYMLKTPNDSYYLPYQKDLEAVGAPKAWDVSTNASSVVVGIIDTGIDATHPDLAANVWKDPVSGAFGMNFIKSGAAPIDDNGHGTHVAGIIGAAGNNSKGIAGTVWNVKMMALKVLDASGSGSTSGVLRAIDYAVSMKVQKKVSISVLNASIGGGGFSAATQQAINAAADAGILFVAAAGNESTNNDKLPSYPASYANVLAVASSNNAGKLSTFSNYSANSVQIAAPGEDILSTYPVALAGGNEPYVFMSGTSMASPRVAGAAALILGANPSLTVAQLKDRILKNAKVLSSLTGKVKTGGLLNLDGAVIVATPVPTPVPTAIPTPRPTATAMPSPTPVVTAKINGTVLLNGAPFVGVTVSAAGLKSVVSDASGKFVLTGLTKGTIVGLKFAKTGYVIAGELPVPVTSDTMNVTISMRVAVGSSARDLKSARKHLIMRRRT